MTVTKTFICFSVLLLTLYLIQWWVLFYQLTDVPEYFPNTPIKVSGFVLALTVMPTVYFFLKGMVNRQPSMNVLQLTGWGVLLAIVTEVLFQIVRQAVTVTSVSKKKPKVPVQLVLQH